MTQQTHRWLDVYMILACRCLPSPQRCYGDGQRRYVSCPECGKAWDIDSREVVAKGKKAK